jgi:hypothetical protein
MQNDSREGTSRESRRTNKAEDQQKWKDIPGEFNAINCNVISPFAPSWEACCSGSLERCRRLCAWRHVLCICSPLGRPWATLGRPLYAPPSTRRFPCALLVSHLPHAAQGSSLGKLPANVTSCCGLVGPRPLIPPPLPPLHPHAAQGSNTDKLSANVSFPLRDLCLHQCASPESPAAPADCIYDLFAVRGPGRGVRGRSRKGLLPLLDPAIV